MLGSGQCCACSVCSANSKDFFSFEWSRLAAGEGEKALLAADGTDVSNEGDVPGDVTTTATVAVGESVIGELETIGDTDWYRITLTAGQTVNISLEGTGASPVSDTYLRLYDENGNEIAINDDGGEGLNSLLRFTATEGGVYYIEADSYANNKIGEYTITVTEAPPLELYTVDQIVLQLTEGYWGGTPRAHNPGGDREITVDITSLTEVEQFLAREALATWTDVTGITFTEVTGGAAITFQNTEEGAYASSSRSGSVITSSTINISSDWVASYGDTLDSYSFQTYVHEIGHALGLGHGGNYNGSASYGNDALYLNDSWATTVMSYFDQRENSYFSQEGFSFARVTTPMMADVAAMIELYGASTTTRLGDTTYGFNSTSDRDQHDATQFQNTAYTIVDSGGYDTLDYSGFGQDQLIDLNVETFMNIGGRTGNISIGRGTVIEAALGGTGNDTMNGNDVVNELRGNDGNDSIDGGAGSDMLYGGAGDDVINGGAGWDRLFGEDGADFLSGLNGSDIIHGGAGNDEIFGLNGDDKLRGGADSDIIYGNNGNDDIRGDEGDDTVFGGSGDDLIDGGDGEDNLQGGIDNDTIRGGYGSDALYGQGGDDVLLGGAGWDRLFGSDGSDELSGGNGNDTLNGGLGIDTLTGDAGADRFMMDMYGEMNLNIITDFDVGADTIWLNRSVGFGSLFYGQLSEGAFALGTEATDEAHRILYDQATGKIFYDSDGVGGEQAFLFAQVTAGTELTAAHFQAFGAPMPPPPLSQDTLTGSDMAVV